MAIRRAVIVACALFAVSSCFAQSNRDRLAKSIDDDSVATLRGNVHPWVKDATKVGPLGPNTQLERVTLVFRHTDAQQRALTKLIAEQQDPQSANYHKWLTPSQFADQFGLTAADINKVKGWLESKGLQVVDVSKSRSWIAVNGTAAQVSAAFGTRLERYSSGDTRFFANSNDPVVPAALAGIVGEIRGLNDVKPKPRARITRKVVDPRFTSSISGNHFLAPDDFATIYDLQSLYANGLNGSGQKIVVVGQTNIQLSDIQAFRSASGLSANVPQLVLVPGSTDPGIVAGDIDEAALDIEWSGAVAREATIVYVYSKNGVFDSLIHAIDNNLAPVISMSYGGCEATYTPSNIATVNTLGQRANAQGQTIVVASGDSGAADCDNDVASATKGLAVDVPAASPWVTAIGGTTFNEGSGNFWNTSNNSLSGSALSYIPEVVWNDTATDGTLSSSGGGKSLKFAKPSWQVGLGVPVDGARDVPDISFAASPDHVGYLYCVQGGCVNGYRAADNSLTVVGGTSAGAPVFAGVVAILNQKANARQGNVNPTLYSLASSSPSIFHDIVSGDNKVPCTIGTSDCTTGTIGFSAGIGYDMATGLGTVDVGALAASWPVGVGATGDFSLTPASTALTFKKGASATDALTITAVNGFSGTVTLSCSVSSSLTSTTCSVSPSSVAGSGAATLTIANSSAVSKNMPSGILFSITGGIAALCFASSRSASGKRKRVATLTMTLLLVVGSLALVSCGGGGTSSNSTTPTTSTTTLSGTVTVTAVSGSITHTSQVSVTVN